MFTYRKTTKHATLCLSPYRSTKHPQIDAGVWGLVTINSRQEHPNKNATCQGEERNSFTVDVHGRICRPTPSNLKSAFCTQRIVHHENSPPSTGPHASWTVYHPRVGYPQGGTTHFVAATSKREPTNSCHIRPDNARLIHPLVRQDPGPLSAQTLFPR